jgi:hypothetical protein
MAINLILPAEDVVTEEDMPDKVMLAVAMSMAKAPPQANILFNWWQNCLPYQINLLLLQRSNITLTTLAKTSQNGDGTTQSSIR